MPGWTRGDEGAGTARVEPGAPSHRGPNRIASSEPRSDHPDQNPRHALFGARRPCPLLHTVYNLLLNLFEYQARDLFAAHGVPVLAGAVASIPEEAQPKPVIGYVAGFTAPEGKTMGHAGAIVSGSVGTARAKKQALEVAGIKVGETPSETAELARSNCSQPSRRRR